MRLRAARAASPGAARKPVSLAAGLNMNLGYGTPGARLGMTIVWGGTTVIPHASAVWQYAFGDATPEIALAFASKGIGHGVRDGGTVIPSCAAPNMIWIFAPSACTLICCPTSLKICKEYSITNLMKSCHANCFRRRSREGREFDCVGSNLMS